MRFVCGVLILAALAFGQAEEVVAHRVVPTSGVKRYLVEYATQEPCTHCSYSYAVSCGPDNPGCSMPMASVSHYVEFNTFTEALEFVNNGFRSDSVSTLLGNLFGSEPSGPRELVRIMAFEDVEISRHVTTREEPQPSKKIESVQYSLPGDERASIADLVDQVIEYGDVRTPSVGAITTPGAITGDSSGTSAGSITLGGGGISSGTVLFTAPSIGPSFSVIWPNTPVKAGDCFRIKETNGFHELVPVPCNAAQKK